MGIADIRKYKDKSGDIDCSMDYHLVLSKKNKPWFMLIFPALLVVGTAIRFLILVINGGLPLPKSHYLLDSSNIINMTFAAKSFQLTFVCLCGVTIILSRFVKTSKDLEIETSASNGPLLPLTNRDARPKKISIVDILLKQSYKCMVLYSWVSILIVWWFGNSIYDRIQIGTGGQCNFPLDSPFYGTSPIYRVCKSEGGTWQGGTKLSGHSLILSCFGTVLIYELRTIVILYLRFDTPDNSTWKHVYDVVIGYSILLITMYILLFSITAIFFHTLFEKVVGLMCGLLISYLFYVSPSTSHIFNL